jgi:hypothetical protein
LVRVCFCLLNLQLLKRLSNGEPLTSKELWDRLTAVCTEFKIHVGGEVITRILASTGQPDLQSSISSINASCPALWRFAGDGPRERLLCTGRVLVRMDCGTSKQTLNNIELERVKRALTPEERRKEAAIVWLKEHAIPFPEGTLLSTAISACRAPDSRSFLSDEDVQLASAVCTETGSWSQRSCWLWLYLLSQAAPVLPAVLQLQAVTTFVVTYALPVQGQRRQPEQRVEQDRGLLMSKAGERQLQTLAGLLLSYFDLDASWSAEKRAERKLQVEQQLVERVAPDLSIMLRSVLHKRATAECVLLKNLVVRTSTGPAPTVCATVAHSEAFINARFCRNLLLCTFLQFSKVVNADCALLLDLDFFHSRGKVEENDMVLLLRYMFAESRRYKRSVIIVDLDSLAEVVRSDTLSLDQKGGHQGAFHSGPSYDILRKSLLYTAIGLINQAPMQSEGESHWVVVLISHPELLIRFCERTCWPTLDEDGRTIMHGSTRRCRHCQQLFSLDDAAAVCTAQHASSKVICVSDAAGGEHSSEVANLPGVPESAMRERMERTNRGQLALNEKPAWPRHAKWQCCLEPLLSRGKGCAQKPHEAEAEPAMRVSGFGVPAPRA